MTVASAGRNALAGLLVLFGVGCVRFDLPVAQVSIWHVPSAQPDVVVAAQVFAQQSGLTYSDTASDRKTPENHVVSLTSHGVNIGGAYVAGGDCLWLSFHPSFEIDSPTAQQRDELRALGRAFESRLRHVSGVTRISHDACGAGTVVPG